MKRLRAILFSIVFQVAIALIILDYQFNPLLLQSNCLLAFGSSDHVEPTSIVDCIACHYFTSRDLGDQFIGHIAIYVPKKNQLEKGMNWEQPFDSQMLRKNNPKQQFQFAANLFTQNSCSYYECSALHVLQDFKMSQSKNLQLLNKHKIQHEYDVIFQIAQMLPIQFSFSLGFLNQTDAIKFTSNSIVRNQLESLIIRARYPAIQKIEEDRSAAILVYQLQTNIYVRFILILVVLLQADRLFQLMAHFKGFIKVILLAILSLGFLSSSTAIVSSSVAIYLTIAKLYNANTYGIVLALLFLISEFALSFSFSSIFVIVYTIAVIAKTIFKNFSFMSLGTLIGIINTTFYMWYAGWAFYIYLVPVLLLGALLSIQQQKNTQNPKYDLINVDEQQDVLYKIKRQLA